MISENFVILCLLLGTVTVSGCTVSDITHPDEPRPEVLNPETEDIGIEGIDRGQVSIGVKNNGEEGKVGVAVVFKNRTGGIAGSKSEVITMAPGERRTVTVKVDVPDTAITYDLFAAVARPKS